MENHIYINHINKAIEMLREKIAPYKIAEGWEYIKNRQPIPATTEAAIYDLLEEYGEDNDLPENWWAEYSADLEDIFMEL